MLGLASSHAYTFIEPDRWDARRETTRGRYAARYGTEAPHRPEVDQETLGTNQVRYENIRQGLSTLRERVATLRPDALIMIGDDQDENFTRENMPQFAIYTGDDLVVADHESSTRRTLKVHKPLATAILTGMVEQCFDLAWSEVFPKGELLSHAHGPALEVVDPLGEIPVVLIFVNAIHVPAPTPARCVAFGQALGRVIAERPPSERVALYASGGLSHFSAGYPWPHYSGPHTVGSICADFDRRAIELMRQGRGHELAALSSADLLANGDVEMRQWLILLGALGAQRPELLIYEPFYRAIMGQAVGYWEPAVAPQSPTAA